MMVKKFFIVALLLFSTIYTYAELSTSTLLLKNTPILDNNNIIITNGNGERVTTTSGLHLYKGDMLQTESEEVILLIPTLATTIEVATYTTIKFDVLSLGGREYIIQLHVEKGQLKVSTHNRNDLLQVIYDIDPPQNIIRKDERTTDINSVSQLYVQIITEIGEIDTSNVTLDKNIFVTEPNTNITEVINTLRRIKSNSAELEEILTIPSEKSKLDISQDITLTAYLSNWTKEQYLAGLYRLHLEIAKLQFSLQVPLIFLRDNKLINPLGQQDLGFGNNIWEKQYDDLAYDRRVLIGTQHFVLDLLGKVNRFSYGTPQDILYIYFGKQTTWHNPNSTLFAYKYQPVSTFNNNFNKDFFLQLDLSKLGNDLRFRQFQLPSPTSPLLTHLDILYNRFWTKPMLPLYGLEVGIVLAIDLNINKFSDGDNDVNTTATDNNRILFLSTDITIPIINRIVYQFDINTEAGWWGLLSEGNVIGPEDAFINWGTKVGMTHTFISPQLNNLENKLLTNVYYSTAMFRPHFAMGGYEYFQKPLYNKIFTSLQRDNSQSIFSSFVITPEIAYGLSSEIYSVSIGTYYPISLTGATISQVYNNYAVFIESTLDVSKFLPEFLNVKFSFVYNNLSIDFTKWDFLTALNFIGGKHAMMDIKMITNILDRFTIDLGFFNTPEYNDTTLVFDNDTGLPSMVQMPYMSFAVNF